MGVEGPGGVPERVAGRGFQGVKEPTSQVRVGGAALAKGEGYTKS